METYVGDACGLDAGEHDARLRACVLRLIVGYEVRAQSTHKSTRPILRYTTCGEQREGGGSTTEVLVEQKHVVLLWWQSSSRGASSASESRLLPSSPKPPSSRRHPGQISLVFPLNLF